MPRTIDLNMELTDEKLNLMRNVVEDEKQLAKALYNSYKKDMETLKNDNSLSDTEKAKRKDIIAKCIEESLEFYYKRYKQSEAISQELDNRENGRSGLKNNNHDMTEIWNDGTLQSKGMDAILEDENNKRNEALKSAAKVIAQAAKKQVEIKEKAETQGEDKPDSTAINPNDIRRYKVAKNAIKSISRQREEIKGRMQAQKDAGNSFDSDSQNGDIDNNKTWLIPLRNPDGSYVLDENGKVVFEEVSDEEFRRRVEVDSKSESEKAAFASKIKGKILDEENGSDDFNKPENPKPHFNIFEKIQGWFDNIFNKEAGTKKPKQPKEQKVKYHKEDKKKIKRTIRKPKAKKRTFKDDKKVLKRAGLIALVIAVAGFGSCKAYQNYIQSQIEAEAQRQAEAAAELQEQQEQQEQEENEQQQEQEIDAEEQNNDTLILHDANILTNGSDSRQYIVRGGLEYAENSLGEGRRGTMGQDEVVQIYNRAIVKDNDDGTSQILVTSNEQTWNDYAESANISVEDLNDMLNQDGAREVVAIQVADTNHNIFNVYGWVDAHELEESSKGTEKLEISNKKAARPQENVRENQEIDR